MGDLKMLAHSRVGRAVVSAAFGCFALLVLNGIHAQQPDQPQAAAAPPPPVTFTVTSREVQLDLLVTDARGRSVTGLKPADITILEDGVPQTIRSMEEHGPSALPSSPPPHLPPNTFTNFAPVTNSNASTVILIDSLNSPIEAQMYLRDQVIRYMYMKAVPAGNPIAIFELDTQMRLVQGFTADPEVLLNAVKSRRNDPKLSLLLQPRNEVYRRYRSDILNAGLREMGRYLAAFPGRKSLIWLTGNIPTYVYGSNTPFNDSLHFPDGVDLLGRDGAGSDLSQVTDQLTLSRVAVYPIDSRGLMVDPGNDISRRRPGASPNGFGIHQAYDHLQLDEVAEATGGKAFYNDNGLKNDIAEIVETGSHYYTLAYSTTNKQWDGKYRHIKITPVAAAGGLNLQYRRGYYARSYAKREKREYAALQKRQTSSEYQPQDAGSPSADPAQSTAGGAVPARPKEGLDAAMAFGGVPTTELVFQASLAPSPTIQTPGKGEPLPQENHLRPEFAHKAFRDFHILYQADAHKLTLTAAADGKRHGELEFVAVVYEAGGAVVNSLKTSLELNLSDANYRTMLQHGFGLNQVIAIPVKGNYFLRLGLNDPIGGSVGVLEIPVDQIQLGVGGANQKMP